MSAPHIEVLLDAHANVGESPTWDCDRGVLVWVDIYMNQVHLLEVSAGSDRVIDIGQPVGAVATASTGHLMLALRDGFGQLDVETEKVTLLAGIDDGAADSLMNDGKCDPQGRFLAGTTTVSETPGAGSLYRLSQDLGVESILSNVTLSNGLDWSPDGRLMYYIDSLLQRIDMFDYDAGGKLSHRRTFAEIPAEMGMPDGLTVDAEGHVWVALWGGSAVHRFRPNGTLERRIDLPVSQVTSCTFGGPDLRDLFITSASWGFDAERLREEPHAGAIFVTCPGVAGLPSHRFGVIDSGQSDHAGPRNDTVTICREGSGQ